MPWGRLDDTLYDHPKVEDRLPDTLPGEASGRNEAVGLWARAVSWCNRYLTDGRITRSRLVKLDGRDETIDALVSAGFLDTVPGSGPGVYTVHDFLEYNDSKDEIERRRAQTREAGRRSGAARKNAPSSEPSNVPPNASPNVAPSEPSNAAPNDPPNGTGNEPLNATSRARAGAARPVPSRTRPDPSIDSTREVPPAVHRANGTGNPSSKKATTTAEPSLAVTLTPAQLDAWRSFTDPVWRPFMAAWLERGFRLPPRGEASDEPGEGDPSARAMLFEIADNRPNDLGRWTREAEPGSRPNEVIAYIVRQWHALRDRLDAGEDARPDSGPSKAEAGEALGAILARITSGGRLNGKADDDALDAFGS